MPAEILRSPVPVTGAVEGLLCRGMPLMGDGVQTRNATVMHAYPGGYMIAYDAGPDDTWRHFAGMPAAGVSVDWSSPTALDAAIRWLMDRGHDVAWMRPLRYGGRVPAWDGLSEDEVAAILVSVSVRGVAEGRVPPRTVARAYGTPTNARSSLDNIGGASVWWCATERDRDYFIAPTRLGPGVRATPDNVGWLYTPQIGLSSFGMEVGVDAVAKINECALSDGCVLLPLGGVMVGVPDAR